MKTRSSFFISVLLPTVMFCCAPAPDPEVAKESSLTAPGIGGASMTLGEWHLFAPEMAAPACPLRLSLTTSFPEARDILVDLLDARGWYAKTRITLGQGEQHTELALDLPSTVGDPATAFLSAKVLPVGASWEAYLDEKQLSLIWPVSSPIPAQLYFGGTLSAWNYPFASPIGVQGAQIVAVGRAAESDPDRVGPFQGAYAIQSFASTYGVFMTSYGLNLETGEVYRRTIDRTRAPALDQMTRRAVPATSEALVSYSELLDGLRAAVHHDATSSPSNHGVEWPQLAEAEAYLSDASAALYARLGERLSGAFEPSPELPLSAGRVNTIPVAYGAASDRDLLVDLLIDDQWVAGSRTAISRGSGRIDALLEVPVNLGPTHAFVYVKIVPSGQPWTAMTTELAIPVAIFDSDVPR